MPASVDGAPAGYGQRPPSQGGAKTALLAVVALVMGLGGGLLIGWPIFSVGGATEVGSAEHDRVVACEYAAGLSDGSEFEFEDVRDPLLWQLQGLS